VRFYSLWKNTPPILFNLRMARGTDGHEVVGVES